MILDSSNLIQKKLYCYKYSTDTVIYEIRLLYHIRLTLETLEVLNQNAANRDFLVNRTNLLTQSLIKVSQINCYPYIYPSVHTLSLSPSLTHTLADTHSLTHAHTHTRTHTHTHTQTHTHTLILTRLHTYLFVWLLF